jgi:hypothetical protein
MIVVLDFCLCCGVEKGSKEVYKITYESDEGKVFG